MKKSLLIVVALLLAASMLFAGCASKSDESSYTANDYYAEEPAEAPMEDTAYDSVDSEESMEKDGGSAIEMGEGKSILEPSVDRKIIYSGNISARTKNFDEDYADILAKVKQAGGYIESAYVHGTEPEEWQDEGRYAEITVRVPSDKFDSFIAMLEGVGKTTNSSVSGRDVSLQYFDIETRLETLRIREERLQSLLEKAESLEDIIELERELANVSYEIQSYEMEKRNFDSLIDYSQISVFLQEVAERAEIVPPEESIGESMKNGFFNVLNGIAVFFRWLLIALVSILPVLVVLGIILAIVLLSVRAARKRKAKKQKQNNDIK